MEKILLYIPLYRQNKLQHKETNSWRELTLKFDSKVRSENLKNLKEFNNGTPLYLSYTNSVWHDMTFKHWFVTDDVNVFEFGSANSYVYSSTVIINTLTYDSAGIIKLDETHMNDEIRSRMNYVLGMCNFSLYLRNCEHVSNYVFYGKWVSSQNDKKGPFDSIIYYGLVKNFMYFLIEIIEFIRGGPINLFKNQLPVDRNKIEDMFPSSKRMVPIDVRKKIYSFIKENASAIQIDYYLDNDDNTFNVLFLGPVGEGKSHLINTLFNQKLFDSDSDSFNSVKKKEIYFIRGRHTIYNSKSNLIEERTIVLMDTIGLCDDDWNESDTISFIKNRISSNILYLDAVVIVIRADRMQPNIVYNIKKQLKWLKYDKDNAAKFIFIATHADNLSSEDKLRMTNEMKGVLDLHPALLPNGEEIQPILFTGFPPEEMLNDLTKERVINCWDKFVRLMDNPEKLDRINIAERNLPWFFMERTYWCSIL